MVCDRPKKVPVREGPVEQPRYEWGKRQPCGEPRLCNRERQEAPANEDSRRREVHWPTCSLAFAREQKRVEENAGRGRDGETAARQNPGQRLPVLWIDQCA